jgi:hypothetical protein
VQPQHWIDAISATLERSATTYSAFSVIRHESDGVVDDKARRRMKLIVPPVRRAVLIGKIIDLHKLEIAAFALTRLTDWELRYFSPTLVVASCTQTRQVMQCSPRPLLFAAAQASSLPSI